MTSQPAAETLKIQHVQEELAREFPTLPREVVESYVDLAATRLDGAPVRAYVPVLVRAGARHELRRLV